MKFSNDTLTVEAGERVEVEVRAGAAVDVQLFYPRENMPEVYVGLFDVRAADDIKIHYDFDRDGWVISQQKSEDDDSWQEVSFVQAWQLDEE